MPSATVGEPTLPPVWKLQIFVPGPAADRGTRLACARSMAAGRLSSQLAAEAPAAATPASPSSRRRLVTRPRARRMPVLTAGRGVLDWISGRDRASRRQARELAAPGERDWRGRHGVAPVAARDRTSPARPGRRRLQAHRCGPAIADRIKAPWCWRGDRLRQYPNQVAGDSGAEAELEGPDQPGQHLGPERRERGVRIRQRPGCQNLGQLGQRGTAGGVLGHAPLRQFTQRPGHAREIWPGMHDPVYHHGWWRTRARSQARTRRWPTRPARPWPARET
jgi:hypothetical protein